MLSVVIITLNEEKKIRDCLELVKWADEIVVVDSFSKDNTVEIARNYTDKIYQREFAGFGKQKNFALSKASGDWILAIDADERVTSELKEEIKRTLANPRASGYYMPRKSYFLGKWIKHCGWWPDYLLRLFRRDCGHFSDRLVHEALEVDGPTGRLNNPLEHHPFCSLSELIRKADRYSTLGAEVIIAESKDCSGKHKVSVLISFLHAWAKFFSMYFIKAGFLDGKEGFILSVLSFYYTLIKYLKLWEKQRKRG